MKKIIFIITFFILIYCSSISAEQKLSIDLVKCRINGISLLRNSDDIADLLGEPSFVKHNYTGEYEFVYASLGLSRLMVGEPFGRIKIYLKNIDFDDERFIPFYGYLSFGITNETKIEDLPDLFKGYKLICEYQGNNLDYYTIDLKTHIIDIYCDSKTHNLVCIILS